MLGIVKVERLTMLRSSRRTLAACAAIATFSLMAVAFYNRPQLNFVGVALHQAWRVRLSSAPSDGSTLLCTPRRNIVFLKTHKCASSTIMNILLRYGVTHNLTFVLPRSRTTHYIGHPALFHHNLIRDIRGYNLTYNILTHHTRFNKGEVAKVMPKDSVYVTVLRKPEDVFESLYSYCRLSEQYNKNLTDFVQDDKLLKLMARKRVVENKIGFNQMCFDLGLRPQDFANGQVVQEFVNFIADTFDLVMIAERLDESLVLLKHLLCWTTEDVVAFRINARLDKYRVEMSPEVKEKLRQFNGADVQLYEYFLQAFEEKVAEFGQDRMAEELQDLRAARQAFYDRCVQAEDVLQNLVPYQKRKEVIAFKKKDSSEQCLYMTLTELEFHELLLKREAELVRNATRLRVS